MSEADVILRLEHVHKRYAAVEGTAAYEVITDVTLDVKRGESLAIIGPSGSGKTTLLNIIGALDAPSSGRVLLDGEDLGSLGEDRRAVIRNQRVGFVFQFHHLLPQCTAWENVLVPTLAGYQQRPRIEIEARARRLLERVGLAGRMNHRPGQLSGGERQRVAVVRAMINQPELLLADEPTGSLDAAAAGELARLLADLNREERVTLIVVTHNPELAALMQQTLVLRGGSLASKDGKS